MVVVAAGGGGGADRMHLVVVDRMLQVAAAPAAEVVDRMDQNSRGRWCTLHN